VETSPARFEAARMPPKFCDVALIYGFVANTTRYRCLHAQEQLQLAGLKVVTVPLREEKLLEIVREAAIVVLCRTPYDKQVKKVIDFVRLESKPVVFDIDDLIFDEEIYPAVIQPPHSLGILSALERFLFKDEAHRFAECIRKVGSVVVSTDFLAQEVRKLGKPVWVHRNAFSMEMLRLSNQALKQKPDPSRGRIVIGYASGTPTHDRDFQVAQPALKRILEEHPETELRIVGYLSTHFNWGSVKSRVKYVPFVPWQELPFLLAQFDINIAPLDINNRFCQAKSEVKYIEAGLVAVPTVASRIGAFEYATHNGKTGLLAETGEDWYRCLKMLVADSKFRRELGERAREDVLTRYHPSVRAKELINTLNEIGKTIYGRPFWSEQEIPHVDLQTLNQCYSKQEGRVYTFELSPHPKRSLVAKAWAILRDKGLRTFLLFALFFVVRRISRFRKPERHDVC
jgi:glycosyltransferase involved in cell wall biosynthesis